MRRPGDELLAEAKATLPELVRAVNGENVVVACRGRPRVRLGPVSVRTERWAGRGWIAPDFDAPVDDLFEALADT